MFNPSKISIHIDLQSLYPPERKQLRHVWPFDPTKDAVFFGIHPKKLGHRTNEWGEKQTLEVAAPIWRSNEWVAPKKTCAAF